MQRAACAHAFQIALELLDAHGDAPPVRFELCFARTARTDAAAQPRERMSLAGKAREHIFQLRQFHLQAAFRSARPVRKYVEDQLRPVDDFDRGSFFEVALLRRREVVIDDQNV
jgi:hypothetical protein